MIKSKESWLHLNTEEFHTLYPGSSFIVEFCYSKTNHPIAIFHQPNFNKDLGHKEYIGFFKNGTSLYITGFSKEDLDKEAIHSAIECQDCNDIIFSIDNHDMARCTCGKCLIDGGKDYTRIGFSSKGGYKPCSLNLLTNEVKYL